MINLKKYLLSIIYKTNNLPKTIDLDFWDNLKFIDIEEV